MHGPKGYLLALGEVKPSDDRVITSIHESRDAENMDTNFLHLTLDIQFQGRNTPFETDFLIV